MNTTTLNPALSNFKAVEAQLAYRLTMSSFEHEYYKSCMDECFDPGLQEDLLHKMNEVIQHYQSTRAEFEKLNPKALSEFELSLTDQKNTYFSRVVLN